MLEEAKKRDHRKLGKELGLFTLHGRGPRLPVLPAQRHGAQEPARSTTGARSIREHGYVEISTPDHAQPAISGSAPATGITIRIICIPPSSTTRTSRIKPMNCPGGMLVYKSAAALLPRPAAACRRAGHRAPPRAVRRAARPDARALLHAGRRAHLHDARSDQGRDQGRCQAHRRGVLALRLQVPHGAVHHAGGSHRHGRAVGGCDQRPRRARSTSSASPMSSTRATARSTARRSTSIWKTASAAPGSAARSSWICRCPSALTLSMSARTARSTARS